MSEHSMAVKVLRSAGFAAAPGAPHDEHDGTIVDVTLPSKDWAVIEQAKALAAEQGCEVRFLIEPPDEPENTPQTPVM